MPGTKVVKPAHVSSPDKRVPKPSDEVINAVTECTAQLDHFATREIKQSY